MHIQPIKSGALEYAVIDNFYTEEQLETIKNELPFVYSKATKEDTDSAVVLGEMLKDNKSIFLDELYKGNRQASSILNLNRKIFDVTLSSILTDTNCFYGHIQKCTEDSTLVNFYTGQEQYKAHYDIAVLTGITMLKLGDFTGGELRFSEHNVDVEFVDNRLVIFPGCILHETRPISGNAEATRVTIAQFLNCIRR